MNFQAVDQANGKNVTMWATMDTWDGIAFTTNQAKYLSCKLKDDNDVEHKCRIYEGKGSLPGQEHLNKRMEFSIGSYQGNYKGQPYTGYSGFWSHGAVKGSQDGSQSSQGSAQATNPQQSAPQGMSQQDAATVAINAAARIYGVATEETPAAEAARFLIEIAEPIKRWILNEPIHSNQSIQDEPVKAQFCDGCRNLKEECTCDVPF